MAEILKKKLLVIITEGHPDVDTGFIYPELKTVSAFFERIEIYPLRWGDTGTEYLFPVNVIINNDLADYIRSLNSVQKKALGVTSRIFRRNFRRKSLSELRSLLNTAGLGEAVSAWLAKKKFNKNSTLFYSYWLTISAVALSLLKESGMITYFISRAHGFDLYDERGDKILNYLKPYIFSRVNKIYCISEHGRNYLNNNYKIGSKCFVSRLGTVNGREILMNRNCQTLEAVSCSYISPVKRIELLIEGISFFQSNNPEITIHWTHIGGGSHLNRIERICSEKLKAGSYYLKGNMYINEILNLYSTKYFDFFINVSESEGLPVSIMEAQSGGIPVIATSVGGIPEIVSNDNGLLLSADPAPREISDAILLVNNNPESWKNKRVKSRVNWESHFRAEKNYTMFGNEIASIISNR